MEPVLKVFIIKKVLHQTLWTNVIIQNQLVIVVVKMVLNFIEALNQVENVDKVGISNMKERIIIVNFIER